MSKMLDALREQRAAKAAEAAALLDGEPTPEALQTVEERHGEIAGLDEQIKTVEETEARSAAIAESRQASGVSPVAVVKSEPMTYSENSERSYFRDLANAQIRNDRDAWDRLYRHMDEVRVESRAVDRTDGGIGEFVPPLWLVDMFAKTLRPGRVTADRLTKMALPGGTDSISIPRITTGTDTGIQATDGTATTTQDMVTTSVTAPVRTIAGYAVASQQLLDQSPLAGGIDQLIFQDLAQAYDNNLNVQVINGVGTAGEMYGLLNTVGIGTVTYTTGTVTAAGFQDAFAKALSNVAKARFAGAEAIVLHPSIWYGLVGLSDTAGRPIVVPNQSGPFNAVGVNGAPGAATGPVGTLLGLDCYLDPGIPLVSSARPALVARFSDTILMESGPRTRVIIGDTTGRQLQVNFQLYGYAAIAARYPAGIVKCVGTGFNPVSGY